MGDRIEVLVSPRRHGKTHQWRAVFAGELMAVLAGTRPQLFAALQAAHDELVTYCVAEHENALHNAAPEPGCPDCARELAEDAEEDEAFQRNADLDRFAAALAAMPEPGADGRCPACGEPGLCEIACDDPDCYSRDCESHEACERPETPSPPGRYPFIDNPREAVHG